MHPIDILIVGSEPQLVLYVALRLETLRRDDLAHAERFSMAAYPLDVAQRIFEFSLGWSEHRGLKVTIL